VGTSKSYNCTRPRIYNAYEIASDQHAHVKHPGLTWFHIIYGSSGKRVPGQFTGEERDCKNVIPAKAGILEGRLGLAKQFFIPAFAGMTT
jgi:hypothetical protein